MPHAQKEGIFLAFDFGTKYLGLAVGQRITKTATPLTTLRVTHAIPQWEQLDPIIEKWQPCALIVGLALQLDGSHSQTSLAAKTFAQRLEKRFALPIHFVEERLTTVAARERLKETAPFRSQKQQGIDAMAATLILESWFHDLS